MPLLKGTAGKAMPDMAIGYITRKDKAKYIDVQNLFIDEDFSAQFKETAARFGKCTDYDERKYYHFKLSPDRADHADPFRVQEYAKAYAEKAFPDCECVIATHTDTKTVHAHIIVEQAHRGNASGYGGDGVRSDNNRGQSGTGNQNGNRENRETQREHRNTSQKGGFDFCK